MCEHMDEDSIASYFVFAILAIPVPLLLSWERFVGRSWLRCKPAVVKDPGGPGTHCENTE